MKTRYITLLFLTLFLATCKVYSIGGQKQTRIKRGINIIITSKGEAKKVIAK